MRRLSWRRSACVFAAFVIVSLVQSWPLPRHLGTTLTGQPSGDTGVYVWNTWVFRHELVSGGKSPFFTRTVLPLDGPTDLSLHNYTPFADLLAIPLQPALGVVATFNIIYLLNVALAGFGLFLLAHRWTGRTIESFLAGVFFACSPYLVARSGAHFSLVAAAPLPIFVYWWERAWESGRGRDGIFAGICVAWAWACDPYYAVYCAMLGGAVAVARLFTIARAAETGAWADRTIRGLDAAILLVVAVTAIIAGFAGGELHVGPWVISMNTLYTPVLLLSVMVTARVWIAGRWRIRVREGVAILSHLRVAAAAAIATALLLGPELFAMTMRVVEGRLVQVPVLWRSSAPGVDLLNFFLPNPQHPLAPASWSAWLASQPGGFTDQVASLSLVALGVIAFAIWRAGFRPSGQWLLITLGFASLTLGPFVRIAGWQTDIPTPWTFLRYAPLISAARMPPRFDVVVIMGASVLFASALVALGAYAGRHRRAMLATVGVLLAFELLPAPRTLYAANVPRIYETIAADPRPVRVLELPFGIRDGLSSMGDFSAASQFYQTQHGKDLVGGYLSRVTTKCKDFYRRIPVTRALMTLSEHRTLRPGVAELAAQSADDFVARSQLGYVVVDVARVTPQLREFAIDTLHLKKIGEADGYELFVPAAAVATAQVVR